MIRPPPRSTLFPTRRSSDLVVHDLHRLAARAEAEQTGMLGSRDLSSAGGPLRCALVALEVEPVLEGSGAVVVLLDVRRVRSGGVEGVPDPLGTGGEHLVVVVGRQRWPAVPVADAHRLFGDRKRVV